jgi:hypothetical protein
LGKKNKLPKKNLIKKLQNGEREREREKKPKISSMFQLELPNIVLLLLLSSYLFNTL